jgi:GNAT superfamily N-acetyltransferase
MLYQLATDYERVLPLFRAHLKDPLLYAVLEGRREGRVYADDPAQPGFAFVWTCSECAYLAGREDEVEIGPALRQLLEAEIIPAAKDEGSDYLSLFSFPSAYASGLEHLLADLMPLRTPVTTFSFCAEAIGLQPRFARLPAGYTLAPIDGHVLQDLENVDLAGAIIRNWGPAGTLPQDLGFCVLADDELVSWCYVQAIGCDSQTVDVWTAPDHRRKGLGTVVAAAWIESCLAQGHTPFWLCDKANTPSRKLAQRLGFEYEGEIDLVDVPFYPFDFYRDLASRFFLPQHAYREAAEAFEKAFLIKEADADDYYDAAFAWASAGDVEKAGLNLQKAIQRGARSLPNPQ